MHQNLVIHPGESLPRELGGAVGAPVVDDHDGEADPGGTGHGGRPHGTAPQHGHQREREVERRRGERVQHTEPDRFRGLGAAGSQRGGSHCQARASSGDGSCMQRG